MSKINRVYDYWNEVYEEIEVEEEVKPTASLDDKANLDFFCICYGLCFILLSM